jgi:phosphate transport system substrate-binding protein
MSQHTTPPHRKNIGIVLLTLLLLTTLGVTMFSGCTQQQTQGSSIVLIGRDSASGTRDFFWTNVMGKTNFSQNLLEKNSNGAIQLTVAQTPGAIGYVGLGFIDATVKALPINNVAPTVAHVLDNTYPISRDLYMFTKGNATGAALEFILYIQSTEGQAIVQQEGFVPIQNTTHYSTVGKTLSGTLTLSGSTTVFPIAEKAATSFKTLYSNLQITVSPGGSGAGITAVSQGTVNIGMSSRSLQPSEASLGLVRYTISKDGIAIIVNPQNTFVTGLTLAQLKAIYQGQITTWDQLQTS